MDACRHIVLGHMIDADPMTGAVRHGAVGSALARGLRHRQQETAKGSPAPPELLVCGKALERENEMKKSSSCRFA